MIYVIDTNVISEIVRPAPNPSVVSWLTSMRRSRLAIASVTAAELLGGVELMAKGRRRKELDEVVSDWIYSVLDGRVLPFDRECAEVFAVLSAERSRLGRPVDAMDLMIAAIALNAGATLVTRNTRHFEGHGLDVFDPWTF
ncbi:type II toxin-antitoxin system VapC family toxin [Chthonobacter albigriseus]|uniref:type II toxin-antitoxin system VapC family toxin n=1 Tax=Chthonobacter albigriseus TaxID=1683161 RepID=UPI0015EFD3CD|nr:type II toxin-antitoxin system VapC family toxin [Chthonobacter albigriseus]